LKKAIVQFASNSQHFAVTLEILKDAEKFNTQYYYYIWGSKTKYPGRAAIYFESLIKRPPKKYKSLIKASNHSVNYSSSLDFNHKWVKLTTSIFMDRIKAVTCLENLKDLNYKGIKPGPALVNEIATITRNIDFEINRYKKLFRILIESYLQVYDATIKIINDNQISSILIYNGRFIHEKAVWDAAKSKNIKVEVYETIRDRYVIQSEGFHSRINNQKIMIEHWNNSNLSEQRKLDIGSRYYKEMRSDLNPFRIESSKVFEIEKPYFVYFSSSDDEYIGLGKDWEKNLGYQIQCVEKLQEIFDKQKKFELIIRLHPNLRNKSKEQKLAWGNLTNSTNSRIIGPNTKISSYDLLTRAEGIITFGSTIGLESAYAEKPSLTLADCSYDLLGVVDKAKNWKEVVEWINTGCRINIEEITLRKNNSCIRGYYLETAGKAFKYTKLKQTGYGSWQAIKFLDEKIYSDNYLTYYQRLINKIKFLKIKWLIFNDR